MGTPLIPEPAAGAARADTDDGPVADLLRPFVVVAVVAAVMWVQELVDLVPGTPFDSWGIRPRSVRGVLGIPLAPFLHDGYQLLLAD